jgi:hypothetical protein
MGNSLDDVAGVSEPPPPQPTKSNDAVTTEIKFLFFILNP